MSETKKRYEEGLDTIKYLTGITQADFETLKEIAPQASAWVDDIIAIFYDTLYAHARTAAVFHDGERPMREETLRRWYLSVLEVEDEETFWNTQARIGFAHIRRHVNNQFMIGVALKVREAFLEKAIENFGSDRGQEVAQSFDRVLNAVVGLTAEGYDVMSKVAFTESTGADQALIDTLIQQSVDDIQKEVLDE